MFMSFTFALLGLSLVSSLYVKPPTLASETSSFYVQTPIYPPNAVSFLKEHNCLPPVSEAKLSTTGAFKDVDFEHVLAESAVHNTVLYTALAEREINDAHVKKSTMNNVQTWEPLLKKYPGKLIAFCCEPWLKEHFTKAGFRVFCKESFAQQLNLQSGQTDPLRTFRLAALTEMVLSAGYNSLYIDIGNTIAWTDAGQPDIGNVIDPFEQLLKLDPQGEAFFSPDRFKEGTAEPLWNMLGLHHDPKNLSDVPELDVDLDSDDGSPCCHGDDFHPLLPWSNALMFMRPTQEAIRLVRLMKERSIPVEHGGGGVCSTHAAHELAWFEACEKAKCRTLDPYIFPSEASKSCRITGLFAIVGAENHHSAEAAGLLQEEAMNAAGETINAAGETINAEGEKQCWSKRGKHKCTRQGA